MTQPLSPLVRTTQAYAQVSLNASRVASLGDWPDHIPPASLALRIPVPQSPAPAGFDAGIACALDLIPRSLQRLSATLHAAYTPAAVAQVRREANSLPLTPDAQVTWWLAACSVCDEGLATPDSFVDQLERFAIVADDPFLRVRAATDTLLTMSHSFELRAGIPFATVDGGMQGAYIAGYDLATAYSESADLYFIGTYLPTLGLDHFPWTQPADPASPDPSARLGSSGPVHGSSQFVKCADEAEFISALAAVSLPPPSLN